MKQHISIEQLNELDDKQKVKLQNWWKPKIGDNFASWYEDELDDDTVFEWTEYNDEITSIRGSIDDDFISINNCFPLLSIGQMIEFLGDDWYKHFFIVTSFDAVYPDHHPLNDELCDDLWESVKEVLNR